MKYLFSEAHLSDDGVYRFSLSRRWAMDGPRVVWIMLNPSTADAQQDDPTIRRCVAFSKLWGAADLMVVNLFSYRATKPADLLKLSREAAIGPIDMVTPANDGRPRRGLVRHADDIIVAAWGRHGSLHGRAEEVTPELRQAGARCLGRTADGQPRHPLMLPYTAALAAL